jgi:hypothetical protein
MEQPLKIYSQINLVMKDLGPIAKDRKNTHQGYAFRGIEDLYNAIHPVLVKHGVFCAPSVVDTKNETFQKADGKNSYRVLLTVNHRFFASDGSFVDVVTIGEGVDTSDKASNKAMSAAMKYAFVELFAIPTADIEDADRTTPGAPPVEDFNNFKPRTLGAKPQVTSKLGAKLTQKKEASNGSNGTKEG